MNPPQHPAPIDAADGAASSPPAPFEIRQNQLERLRLRHLRLLDLVAERGSLSAAASALHLSQPAATHMLRELETILGTALIVRSTAGSTLTPAGEVALQRLRVALGAVRSAAESVLRQPVAPLVRIGMIPAIGVYLLPRLTRALEASALMPRLVIHEANVPTLVDMLARSEIDAMIGRLDQEDGHVALADDIVTEVLEWEQLRVACAIDHPLAQGGAITPRELRMASWVVAPPQTRTRRTFDQYFLDAGLVAPVPNIESFSFHTNLCIAAETRLLTLAPRSAVMHYAALGRVIDLTLEHPFPRGNVVWVRHRDVNFPALQTIVVSLRGLATDEPAAPTTR